MEKEIIINGVKYRAVEEEAIVKKQSKANT